MATTLVIQGMPDPSPERSELAGGLPPGSVKTRHAVLLGTARDAGTRLRLTEVPANDIVEIEFEDGFKLWSRVDDLERELGLRRSRDGDGEAIEIPRALSVGGASRGWPTWAIKALKVLGIDLDQRIAGLVADHVESRLRPGPGLYRCSESGVDDLTRPRAQKSPGPMLVFLHGTGSSTSGSFGGLWRGEAGSPVGELFKRYEGRVLALQHETLTKSPIENAVALVEALLPICEKGAEIHLVSHSRGGLIGELLARGMRVGAAPFTPSDIGLFDAPDRTRDKRALTELNRLLQTAQLRVTKFVRVACPARGTTLADGRLDRYFSVLINLLSWIPGLKGNPVYDGLTALLAGVLKERTKPEDLPGLEAMMPGSPLVMMLNRPDAVTAADLHVLGGDLAGTGLFGRLKTLASDLYYREDHDLIVNTPAMLGGTARKDTVRYWIDTGPDVTHFHYFLRPDTTSRLLGALTGRPAEFRELTVEPFAVTADDYRKRAPVPQPVVFVLPGTMGSELRLGDVPVWMDLLALARGGFAQLGTSARNVRPTGLVRSGYGQLCKYLAATHDVVPFPYDWRRSVEETAEALREALDAALDAAEPQKQPVRILAHSMGGLVVRAMLATPGGKKTWDRMCQHPGARFVMLGTPNGGSAAITAMLIGRDALVKKLALLDLRHDYPGLLGTIATFEGVLNLLPYAGGDRDMLRASSWRTLFDKDVPLSERGLFTSPVASSKSAGFKWTIPEAAALASASRTRARIQGSPLDPARMIYVAGIADQTAADVVVDGDRVKVLASEHGDGRVLWKTGIPDGLRAFYMDAVHGDLASTEDAFPALLDLLESGTTTKLPSTAPQRRAAANETVEMREPTPAMMPDQEELIASALGGRRRPLAAPRERPRVHVRVVHDNLTNATSPVLVGHYEQDVIVAGEGYLDSALDGRLTELQQMDLYPGPIGTAETVLNSEDLTKRGHHPGAIVAGLGVVGDLTPGRLTTTLAQALTRYGADCVGGERRRRQREPGAGLDLSPVVPLSVTALLVGSGEAGVTLGDGVLAVLRAVVQANDRLRLAGLAHGTEGTDRGPKLTAAIRSVDILELYEDRAIEAVHALKNLARSPEMHDFVFAEHLVQGSEGQRRVRFEQASEWWQRIRIRTCDETLRFEPVTQIARTTSTRVALQRPVIDAFVADAIGGTAFNPDLGSTLFEMLVPNELRAYAPDRRKLVLLLDAASAAIPWELLHDRYDRGSLPLAVGSGMVRQLNVPRGGDRIVRAEGHGALVVGNPPVTDSRFPSLRGAAEEAEAVARLLQDQGYEVRSLIGPAARPMAVYAAVHEQAWRIVHLAGHGVFEFPLTAGGKPVSGLVLDGGVAFTAQDAASMRHVPDLVFINCCHLGQTAGDARPVPQFHRLAANLASEFIGRGARAVVAAGWAVDDAAAKTFARTFYAEMFGASAFGDAVRLARERVFFAHGATNTWGAYQCYGDPSFSLTRGTRRRQPETPVAPREVVEIATRVARQARGAGARRANLLAELEQTVATMPAAWWSRPELCAAVGSAFGDLGELTRAVEWYARILAAERADAPIAALEQLTNLRVRLATRLPATTSAERAKIAAILDDAQGLLDHLIGLGETAERHSIRGSLEKRRAWLAAERPARRRALRAMQAAYARALALCDQKPAARAYALGNLLAADIVLSWASRRRAVPRPVVDALERHRALADELGHASTEFFDLAARADHLLLSALARRVITAASQREIEQAYVEAGLRGIAPRHRQSLIDHLTFLGMMTTEVASPQRTRLGSVLAELAKALSGGGPSTPA